jgi:hypothetical protein
VNLSTRKTRELGRMAAAYASERRAAQREVPRDVVLLEETAA